MVFYLTQHGQQFSQYFAENAKFIGSLNIKDETIEKLKKEDISIQQINQHLKNKEALIAVIFVFNWQVSIIAINSDAFNQIKTKYKNNSMVWYWVSIDKIKNNLSNLEIRELQKISNHKV